MNIKNTIATIVLVLSSLVLVAQEYQISGEIRGLDVNVGYMFIEDENSPRGYRMDSVIFENGKFNFSESVMEPEVMRLSFRSDKLIKWVGRGYIPTNSAYLFFIKFPGANIEVKGEATDFCNAYAYGDEENETLSELHSAIFSPMNDMMNLIRENAVDSILTEEQKKVNEKEAEQIDSKINETKISFLVKNASSIAGLWLMEDMLTRSQIEIEKVAELMKQVDSEKYGRLSYYKALNQRVDGYKKTGVGMIAPEISGVNTPDGTDFSLASLQGKYVIIDFWGTWCHACLAGVPEMKKFRDEHSNKLQIVGLAKDRNVDEVNECMKKYEMDWLNVMIGKGEQDYVAKYNVQGYPTKILLDRNGKILLRSVGEEEGFYTEVEKLIEKK